MRGGELLKREKRFERLARTVKAAGGGRGDDGGFVRAHGMRFKRRAKRKRVVCGRQRPLEKVGKLEEPLGNGRVVSGPAFVG